MEKRINLSKEIKRQVELLPLGSFVCIDLFPSEWSRGGVARALSRLHQKGFLVRHHKGVYSKAIKTKFGPARAGDLKVVAELVNADASKMFGGTILFNSLGLTTQNPKKIEVLNNNSTYEIKVGQIVVCYKKIKPKISKWSQPYIEVLEVLKNLLEIPGANSENVIDWITGRISLLDVTKLMVVLKEYSPKYRALLGAILEEKGLYSIVENMQELVNVNSVYKFKALPCSLKYAEKWDLIDETA